MKKLLLSLFILTGCPKPQPPDVLTDDQNFQLSVNELTLSLHYINLSEYQAEGMRAYVESIERLRKAYGK